MPTGRGDAFLFPDLFDKTRMFQLSNMSKKSTNSKNENQGNWHFAEKSTESGMRLQGGKRDCATYFHKNVSPLTTFTHIHNEINSYDGMIRTITVKVLTLYF